VVDAKLESQFGIYIIERFWDVVLYNELFTSMIELKFWDVVLYN